MAIKYGWYPFHLDLAEVKLYSTVALQQRDEDGDWSGRDSFDFFGVDIFDRDEDKQEVEAWEKNENLRYTKPRRGLSAVAKFSSGGIYLGVPEDKDNVYPEEGGVISFEFILRTLDGNNVTPYNQGSMVYFEGDDEYPRTAEKVVLDCWITPDAMDSIEKMIGSDNMKFHASVVLKCWHWTDPSSETHLYLSKEHSERAQFGSVTASRSFPD